MTEETLLDNRDDGSGIRQTPTGGIDVTHDFETLARSWLATLPADNSVNPSVVESWLQSNNSSLPDHIKSMPLSDVYQMITSLSTDITPFNEEKDPFYFRFQRSDQWMPVYKWLETLKTDEVVNKQEVQDWLLENAEKMKDLSARHTRYHLVHYIRKCHKKILKKIEKKKAMRNGAISPAILGKNCPQHRVHLVYCKKLLNKNQGSHTIVKKSSSKAHKTEEKKLLAMLPSGSVTKLPKDSPTYMVKRNEAFQKYQILTEMEKELGAKFQYLEPAKVATGP